LAEGSQIVGLVRRIDAKSKVRIVENLARL
jgi:hypothetical protein